MDEDAEDIAKEILRGESYSPLFKMSQIMLY